MRTRELPEYRAWCNMKTRCYNKNYSQFSDYGGRGIKVCKRWLHSFENFLKDMGRKPSSKHSLDRIDNNKGYSKSNCKWSTRAEQNRNQRSNYLIAYQGEIRTLADWAKEYEIDRETLKSRLRLGWEIGDALRNKTQGLRLTIDGKHFNSETEASKYFGKSRNWIKRRAIYEQ